MPPRETLIRSIDLHGFIAVRRLLPEPTIDALLLALAEVQHAGVSSRGGSVHAIRDLLEAVPEVQRLARSEPIRDIVEPVLGRGAFVVRGILFDKTPSSNWKVSRHQHLTIAVREPKSVPGFTAWSEKAGVSHVQPPMEVLERMLAVRIHLDDCGPGNGPLQVIPGSHRGGRLNSEDIARWRATTPAIACTTGRGGVVVMRPLILHASSAATLPSHRRVVHLAFAAEELPGGLEWHGRW